MTRFQETIVYAQLGREPEATTAKTRLLELRPNYEAEFWDRMARSNNDLATKYADGLRKAGLNIPEPP